jgi:hypothetical protein
LNIRRWKLRKFEFCMHGIIVWEGLSERWNIVRTLYQQATDNMPSSHQIRECKCMILLSCKSCSFLNLFEDALYWDIVLCKLNNQISNHCSTWFGSHALPPFSWPKISRTSKQPNRKQIYLAYLSYLFLEHGSSKSQ